MSNTINWSRISRFEDDLISKIADRGIKLTEQLGGPPVEKTEAVMDISAAHLAVGLRLDQFVTMRDPDFAHDFFGIRATINRRTGKLENCFLPRCAL